MSERKEPCKNKQEYAVSNKISKKALPNDDAERDLLAQDLKDSKRLGKTK